jgi:uncharacterized membrane protein YdfJ with MMPL/SSD domain
MIMTDDDLNSIAKEADDVVRIERLTHHIQRIREDQHAMRAAIERMSEAVTRLALVEERQAATSQAIERVMQTVERDDSGEVNDGIATNGMRGAYRALGQEIRSLRERAGLIDQGVGL